MGMDRREELYVKALEDALKLVGTFSTIQEAIEQAAARRSGEGLTDSTQALLAKQRWSDDDRRKLAVAMSAHAAQSKEADDFRAGWDRVKTARDVISHSPQIVPLWSPEVDDFVYIDTRPNQPHRRLYGAELSDLVVESKALWGWVWRLS